MNPPRALDLHILYEDDDLIALDKASGLLSHATVDPRRPDAFRLLKSFLQERDGRAPTLSILHRLDVETSGVLLFSKNPALHDYFSEMFRERDVEKIYLGVTDQRPPDSQWWIENFLAPEKKPASKRPRTVPVKSGGDRAATSFQVLAQQKSFFLIEARPETGRRHQIRSHLMTSKCPLLGDPLYGGHPSSRMLLHAWKIRFKHPGSGRPIAVTAPPPVEFPLFPPDSAEDR